MATKAALTALLLVALVAFATATTYTTTVTTVSIDDENQGSRQQQQQCQERVQREQFQSCQNYFQARQGRSPYMGGQDDFLEMNPTRQQGQWQQHLQQCCQDLRSFGRECECEALKQAVRQSQQQQPGGSWQGEQSQQVYRFAQQLPQQCNFQEKQCRIRTIFV